MYDTICNPFIMLDKMPEQKHFFLKKNLLSMKDFHDLKFNSLLDDLNDKMNQFYEHFIECEECYKKANFCSICK